jgi:hypothetical protein
MLKAFNIGPSESMFPAISPATRLAMAYIVAGGASRPEVACVARAGHCCRTMQKVTPFLSFDTQAEEAVA